MACKYCFLLKEFLQLGLGVREFLAPTYFFAVFFPSRLDDSDSVSELI
jgi:hypothetical protein